MAVVRSLFGGPRRRAVLPVVAALALVLGTILPLGALGGSTAPTLGSPIATHAWRSVALATSIGEIGPVPAEVVVGTPAGFAWQALDAQDHRVSDFAVPCELAVTESANGSAAPSWVNASTAGPLYRSANGTYSVPSSAWTGGVLNLSVSVGVAAPVSVRLLGPLLPSLPAPVELAVLSDLDHVVLYAPHAPPPANTTANPRANRTYWHVRDRFGDPVPGAFLVVESSTGSWTSRTLVPVTWGTGGETGAWVNYSLPGSDAGTVVVSDEANTTLLGPISIPALAPPASSSTAPPLSPVALVAVVLLNVGAVAGMGILGFGGRARPRAARTDEEEELRRLAEGRESVVDIVRRAGALELHGIEAAWEPLPAPPAVADWVASLVTDGTLTVTLTEGGRALFSLAERPHRTPSVTLDEDALEQGIARRDAADERDDPRTS